MRLRQPRSLTFFCHFARIFAALALALSFGPIQATEQSAGKARSGSAYPELWEAQDPALARELAQVVRQVGLAPAVARGQLSVSIVDISRPHAPRYAGLNDEQMHYAASLPKIAILLGAFARAEHDGQPLPQAIYDDALRMIRHSSNASATRVLAWVGNEFLIQTLQSEGLRLYDPARNGGLWVGRGYAEGTEYQRDPLHNTSHGANTLQIARFWYLLGTGRLLSPGRSQEMKEMMGNPVFNNKFVRGLAGRKNLRIYRKTGTFKQYHGDGALIETGSGKNQRRYIMAALATAPNGGEWLRQLAAPLYDILSASSPVQ